MTYSLPAIKLDIKNQELALRRNAPQRLIPHWEGSIPIPKMATPFWESQNLTGFCV